MGRWSAADCELARRDWSREPAGPEMDRAVFALNVDDGAGLAEICPSTNPLGALALIECAARSGTSATLRVDPTAPDHRRWSCDLEGDGWWADGYGDTLAIAVCRAHLVFRDDE